jgi:hypothetical protein
MKRQVVDFDGFSRHCMYFDAEAEVNNGYGCIHPEQESVAEDDNGNQHGCCFCCSCPLGIEAEQEDKDNPDDDINWDGLCEDGEVYEDEYLMVDCDENATADQKDALRSYNNFMNRYTNKVPAKD